MLKKILLVGSIVVVVALALVAVVGYAYAQTPEPGNTLCPNFAAGLCGGAQAGQGFGPGGMMGGRWNNSDGSQTYGPGMMNRWNNSAGAQGFGPGMMGRRGGQAGYAQGTGPLHTYMVEGFAEKFGMTSEALQAELDAGKRIYDVAVEKGYTAEQFTDLMTEVRAAALDKAVAAGGITQEQADWMNQRWETRQANGFGPGNCPMFDSNAAPVAP